MGVDIHTFIVKDKKIIAENLYDGRNSEWFNNLQGRGDDIEYERLYTMYGISPQAPDEFNEKYSQKNGYYGFYYISVGEFKEWYEKYKPYLKAGWASVWDAWAIKNKGYIPDYLSHYKEDESEVFIEYNDLYEPSRHIYEYLIEHEIDNDADFQFFFDC